MLVKVPAAFLLDNLLPKIGIRKVFLIVKRKKAQLKLVLNEDS